jgi:hypothetical protein
MASLGSCKCYFCLNALTCFSAETVHTVSARRGVKSLARLWRWHRGVQPQGEELIAQAGMDQAFCA